MQALQTALRTLIAASGPGNPTASLAPDDLAPPTELDLGQVADVGSQFSTTTYDRGYG